MSISELSVNRTLESAGDPARLKALAMAELERHPFRGAWWLPGGHSQTIWPRVFRPRPVTGPVRRERIETPDGDFLDIRIQDGLLEKPTALLLHGLEGSHKSKYISGLHQALGELGWRTISMEFRTCSGEMNLARRMYHMGETSDLDFLVRTLVAREPGIRLYIAGFSLGGNVLGKWLGERGDGVPEPVKAASIISVAYDCTVAARYLDRPSARIYREYFFRTLIPKAIEKEKQYPGTIDLAKLRRCSTFAEFDTHVTAVLHGFRDAVDYWTQTGCGQFLSGIRRPTMLLSSADDPFNPASALPWTLAQQSPWLHPQFTKKGGHVGFVSGPSPWHARYWAEEQTVRFFRIYDGLIPGGSRNEGKGIAR